METKLLSISQNYFSSIVPKIQLMWNILQNDFAFAKYKSWALKRIVLRKQQAFGWRKIFIKRSLRKIEKIENCMFFCFFHENLENSPVCRFLLFLLTVQNAIQEEFFIQNTWYYVRLKTYDVYFTEKINKSSFLNLPYWFMALRTQWNYEKLRFS